MRLLSVKSLEFAAYPDAKKRPKYVIVSHRWFDDGEATYEDVRTSRNTEKRGFAKIKAFAQYIRYNIPAVEWFWIDTCCINKDSAVELSEAINLMFRWYREAEVCIAYLVDVGEVEDTRSFQQSKWFLRGWTLQELLAPRTVVFVTETWQVIGNRGASFSGYCASTTGPGLEGAIAQVTGISKGILHDYKLSEGLSNNQKLEWIEGRKTTREEDMSYALFGILGVTPGANYGEGYKGARQRLIAAINDRDSASTQQVEFYRKIVDWLSPPNPWTNHESARQRHEPRTGAWLLRHSQYLAWKSGSVRLLWMYGKTGCGKTILCSLAIEDMRKHCQNKPNIGHAIFYFSFSDDDKQTYQNLLLSLVVQLGNREVSLSMLRQAYQKVERGQPRLHKLQEILLSSIASYNQVFIHLDALDESPEGEGVRQKVLDGIEELLRRIPNVGMLITSRDMPDIRRVMEELRVEMFPIANQLVNADIRKYVSTRLSRDCKLSRLDHATRTSVEETLVRKADGMFRWVYCQLAELTKSKSTKPKSVQAALLALPKDLYETYEHMLNRISKDDRCHALTLLRWLAYSRSPLSLVELAEAATIDPTDDVFVDGFVDTKNRDHWEDTLDILTGLITIDRADEGEVDDDDGRPAAMNDSRDRSVVHNHQRIGKNTKITLAHSSVKEYLESPHVMTSEAKDFRFDPAREHTILSQSCLVYLSHYSGSSEKRSTDEDLAAFPMLYYAAKTWSHHALLQQCRSSNRQLALLTSNSRKRNWLLVHDPDRPWDRPFESSLTSVGTALYYASQLGLLMAAQELLSVGVDIEAQGGRYGTALQVASARGHLKIMQLLLNHDADVNAQKGYSSTPLRAASAGGHLGIVQLLLYHNADVNTQKGYFCTPLLAASSSSHIKIVQLLLDHEADVDPQGEYCTALQAASLEGCIEIVQLLLDHKANVNAQGGEQGTALQAASARGHLEVVRLLLKFEADVHAQGGEYGTALQAASVQGHPEIVQLLLDHGADVNEQIEHHGTALQAASMEGSTDIVQLLLRHEADVNAEGGFYGTALQTASSGGYPEIVRLLLNHKANVHAPGGEYGTALQAALDRGHEEVVQMLLDAGATVDA